MPREVRRRIWLDRIEWIAFGSCVVGGIAAVWQFVSQTP
jgi:hypothetical protein